MVVEEGAPVLRLALGDIAGLLEYRGLRIVAWIGGVEQEDVYARGLAEGEPA